MKKQKLKVYSIIVEKEGVAGLAEARSLSHVKILLKKEENWTIEEIKTAKIKLMKNVLYSDKNDREYFVLTGKQHVNITY